MRISRLELLLHAPRVRRESGGMAEHSWRTIVWEPVEMRWHGTVTKHKPNGQSFKQQSQPVREEAHER